MRRARLGMLAAAALFAAAACAACSGCGKRPLGEGNVASSSLVTSRTVSPPDAGPVALRDVAMWTNAREGAAEDLASLATQEGAAGLVEAAEDATLRSTALRAMAYANGWGQLPYLAKTAAGSRDEDARLALESVAELAARPRRSEDREDAEELREGCDALATLARTSSASRERRIRVIGALRMMPCPAAELPSELDAR